MLRQGIASACVGAALSLAGSARCGEVDAEQAPQFWAELLAGHPRTFAMEVEASVRASLARLCPAFEGGHWTRVRLAGAAGYEFASDVERWRVNAPGRGAVELGAREAGIAACLRALGGLACEPWRDPAECSRLVELHGALWRHAATLAAWPLIREVAG